MAKFFGKIGFVQTVETEPGVWVEETTERNYRGDLVRVARRLSTSNSVNDNITVSNQINIVADPYAQLNFLYIKYVVYLGIKWKVDNVEVQYPKLILTMGEKYNV